MNTQKPRAHARGVLGTDLRHDTMSTTQICTHSTTFLTWYGGHDFAVDAVGDSLSVDEVGAVTQALSQKCSALTVCFR